LAGFLQGRDGTGVTDFVVSQRAEETMGSIWQDLRFGLRQLRLSPGFTIVGILSLALGIGANTAIFQLIDAIRLRTIPVEKPEQLATVRIADRHWASGNFFSGYSDLTYPMWKQIQQRQQAFSPLAVWAPDEFNLATGGETHYAHGMWVSGEFFNVLELKPEIGRLIEPGDDTPGCGQTGVVISNSFWERNYGGEASALGKKISLNGYPIEIIGVTPANFRGITVGESFDVAVPICVQSSMNTSDDPRLTSRRAWWLSSIGRLKPGSTIASATAQLKVISQQIMEETVPEDYDADGVKHYMEYRLGAFPAANGFSQLRKDSSTGLWLLMGISGLVLLIACANIANLMLARASAREREVAVRLALGASRLRLIRQLLSESFLLAAGGALSGSFLAWILSAWLIGFLSTANHPITVDLSLDWRVLAFTTSLAFLTTALFGLIPALRATAAAPVEALKSGGRGMTASKEKFGLRRILVASQVALSLVLLVGALLFVRSLRNLFTLDTGFQDDGVLIVNLDYAHMKLPNERQHDFERTLVEKIRAIPGVQSAAGAMTTPLSGSMSNDTVLGDTPDKKLSTTMINSVGPDYFKTLETPILEGRDFTDGDTATSPKVAIVNRAFVDKFFDGKDALGKTFRIQMPKGRDIPVFQVVGVVKNSVYNDMHEDFSPTTFFPRTQEDPRDGNPNVSVVIRSNEDLRGLINSVKSAMADVNPSIEIDFHVFKTQVKETLLQDELMATLTVFFGILAGLLAVIGLYGVISYMVAQRRNEIGVRMALGAQRGDVLQMMMREAAVVVGIGLVVGTVLAVIAAKSASSLLFGLKPRDPVTYIVCIVMLAAVAALASLLPARRAAKLDPWTALRDE
jgi:putative ABC transport system permease protein